MERADGHCDRTPLSAPVSIWSCQHRRPVLASRRGGRSQKASSACMCALNGLNTEGEPPCAVAASHAPWMISGFACARASCSFVDEEHTVGSVGVRQPVTLPSLKLVAARKFSIEPSRYGWEPHLSVATPRKRLSQSHSCSYGPAGTRYLCFRTPDGARHASLVCIAVWLRQSASSACCFLAVSSAGSVGTDSLCHACSTSASTSASSEPSTATYSPPPGLGETCSVRAPSGAVDTFTSVAAPTTRVVRAPSTCAGTNTSVRAVVALEGAVAAIAKLRVVSLYTKPISRPLTAIGRMRESMRTCSGLIGPFCTEALWLWLNIPQPPRSFHGQKVEDVACLSWCCTIASSRSPARGAPYSVTKTEAPMAFASRHAESNASQ